MAQGPQTTAFVNVIPMDTERMLENQTVIVEGDHITTIGPVDDVAVDDVSNTRNRLGVMARGHWYTQAELDGLVDEFVATYSK